jgi:hypothetical protein
MASVPYEIEQQVNLRLPRSFNIALVYSVAVPGVHLCGEVGKLIPFTHFIEYEYVLGIKRYIPAEASLIEGVLRDEYYTDVPVMVKRSPTSLE